MKKRSQGVVAVGALPMEGLGESITGSGPSVASSALLAAIGARLVGGDAAICGVVPPEFPTDLIRTIVQTGIDLSRVRQATAADVARGRFEATPDQLASISPEWSVQVSGASPPWLRQMASAVSGRVASIVLNLIYETGDVVPEADVVLALAPECDAILCGRTEVDRTWPGQPPRDVLRLLARNGASAAVIKLGTGGSIGTRESEITWMPAFPVAAKTPKPAGAGYAGAFAASYAVDHDLPRAMAWATAAASAIAESPDPLELLNAFGVRTVESRARMLEADARLG